MLNQKILLGAKYVVGATWILGLLEIYFQVTAIPTLWLWWLVVVSLVLHFLQCIYFYKKYASQVDSLAPHFFQIMLFGMAHVLTLQVSDEQ